MAEFWDSLAFVALAESGDKSQLVAIAFAVRYRVWQVLVGVAIATLIVHFFSVIIGRVAGDAMPETTVGVVAGIAFIGFGIWTLRGDTISEEDTRERVGFMPVLVVGVAFFIAELGDKTMLATVALATRLDHFVGVWLGSTVGMVAADALAVGIGAAAGRRLPERPIKLGAAAIFIGFGVWMIADAAGVV
ncbi:MAG: TMEM165/GDT1 family protein [Dehalococcoidia bacterium]